ncbi:helix-turn-helix domain-containing protein [Phytohabitans houttuyneae]|uniref:Helix-turn-helix domain-containing protein n=1 Tax=Phytohabitans houttuyneae TaxID=1076126 RepID=A0A6V8KAL3_9ACTN|nr:helix-turn-helix domain-containing protein [Phytohabitans houttuyneae]GFJ79501.1 hypothetical protein Phou_036810 [Phytohabitans houttuyneae]
MSRAPNEQPRRAAWPFPGDNPLVRARKIAHMYRARLRALDVPACDEADATARMFGEDWAVPQLVTVEDDDVLRPSEAADFLCTSTANVRRLRLAGRLKGIETNEGWRYRVADLRELQNGRPRGGS